MKKTQLRAAILQQLQQELSRQTHAAAASRDEAISEESRAENKWDTHSQEAAYLAEGQAKLAAEIQASIELYGTLPFPDFAAGEGIAVGALVELESAAGIRTRCFLGPRAGGIELMLEGETILVLTPQSPLGRQLLGKHAGDRLVSTGRGSSGAQRIVSVA